MLNIFRSLFKGNKISEKNILVGDRCKAVLVNAPVKLSGHIGEEAVAYYVDSHLFIQNEAMGVYRTSEVDHVKQMGDTLYFTTRNSEYALRMF
ncbi:hypothetical protein DW886_15595 [Enterocloster aldenensis]|uniref:hypothetical protein n=1 Tax=Enterocloster aldenensis TaxID=358742 RepID=UPI000E5088DB|nr:hypothetical protein DW886_15595 [Enterocloster aldenensis]